MQIEISVHRILKFEIRLDEVQESKQKKELYFRLLSLLFLNKAVMLVTVEPQKVQSIGYEFERANEVVVDNRKFLINDIKECTSNILTEISKSEEFELGLLLMVLNRDDLVLNYENILRHISSKIGMENVPTLTVVCEDDGCLFSMYNTKADLDEVKLIAEKVASRVDTKKKAL